jgi:hypothetical protein
MTYPTAEQIEQIEAEIEELREGRLAARKDARSGNPAKRIQGQRAVEGITALINQRRALISKEDES